MKEIENQTWCELEQLLNNVSNERVDDTDGFGSVPTTNARAAQAMITKLGMARRKPFP